LNIREIAGLSPHYYEINREERNYAAIFFSALCRPGNAERFLRYCGIADSIGPDFGIYFEYAYLRDLWKTLECDVTKKEIIRGQLKLSGIDALLDLPIVEINRRFGVGGEPSVKFVEYPGKWSIIKFNESFPGNEDFLKICRFKWSFNIKPDIVIHLARSKAICIEAKHASGEGSYPSSGTEKAIFKERGIPYVRQMELQKYMMEELLGVKTDFMALVSKKEERRTHKVVSWAEAFGCLDLEEMPFFAVEMAKVISGGGKAS